MFINNVKSWCKEVLQIHPITLQFTIWNSATEVENILGIDSSHISDVCKLKRPHVYGYYWRYLDDYIKEINCESYIKSYPVTNLLLNEKFVCDIFNFTIYKNLSNYINPCFTTLPSEEFRDVKGYEDLCKISNFGRVISFHNKPYIKELTKTINNSGYYTVSLTDINGIKKNVLIHRLVSEAFIPNPDNLPFVNHKDENKLNNHVSNLEWCTHEYNMNYGTRIIRAAKSNGNPVEQIDKNTGIVINEFWSAVEAQRSTGIDNRRILEVCNNERKTAGDFRWRKKI